MQVIIINEVDDFINGLDLKANTKVKKRLALLRDYGHLIRMPHSKYIAPGIFELRMVGRDNIRLIYTFKNDAAVLFHAYVKKTEEITNQEMAIIKQKFTLLQLCLI